MRSPTRALLWEIGRRHRAFVVVIVALTLAGRILAASERGLESSPLVELSWMVSFGLVFGMFTYIESSDGRALGGFPRRLFTLPMSTLRLVSIPTCAGIFSVELLYLLWLDPLSRGGSTSPWFVAVLLAAAMVCYQAAFWTLERLGPVRLMAAGAVAVAGFVAGVLPSFPPTPPPPWRSETAVASLTAGVAVVVFLLAWRHIVRVRCGGGPGASRFESLLASHPIALPSARRAFSSPAAAHFWFEWRCSGLALPLLVGGVLLAIILPYTWFARDSAGWSVQLLLGALAMPIVLAIPLGMAFGRPTFWSDDLSLPAFVAVRPLTDEEIVAIKVKVAAASVAASWLLVITFVAVWLSLWGNRDGIVRFAIQSQVFDGFSVAALSGAAALIVIAAMFLTWRFLIIRLWSGLSGSRPLFIASVLSVVIAVIAWMVFDGPRLPGWILEDPGRVTTIAWILAVAVTAKYVLAAYSWRRISPHHLRHSLLLSAIGTTCFLVLGVLFWGVVRTYVPPDIHGVRIGMVLAALLVMPLGRMGLAPSCLSRNRHR